MHSDACIAATKKDAVSLRNFCFPAMTDYLYTFSPLSVVCVHYSRRNGKSQAKNIWRPACAEQPGYGIIKPVKQKTAAVCCERIEVPYEKRTDCPSDRQRASGPDLVLAPPRRSLRNQSNLPFGAGPDCAVSGLCFYRCLHFLLSMDRRKLSVDVPRNPAGCRRRALVHHRRHVGSAGLQHPVSRELCAALPVFTEICPRKIRHHHQNRL